MLDILRDSAWQGIAGIIAGVALLLYIYVERDKLFVGLNRQVRFALYFPITVMIIVILALGILFGVTIIFGASVITFTLVTSLNGPIGILLASSLLGVGLASYFFLFHFIFFRDTIKNIILHMLVIFATLPLYGVLMGISVINSSESSIQAAQIIFSWGKGVFSGGTVILVALFMNKYLA